MSQTLGLGVSGAATQWYLPGTDIGLLPQAPPGAPPPVSDALAVLLGPPVAPGLAYDGRVLVSEDANGLLVDVIGAWNSVKNGSFVSTDAARVTMSGFVHADVTLGGDLASEVTLIGAKRGNVATGAGDDLVRVSIATNGATWVNEFRIGTGAGDDVVTVGVLDIAAAAAAGDATFAATANGAGALTGQDAGTRVITALGAGDDRFVALGASRDIVLGGSGADIIFAGAGDDVLRGGADADLFLFAAGDGDDEVRDFTPGEDRLSFVGLGVAQVQEILDGAVAADGGTLLVYGVDSVFLAGLAPAALSLSDLL